MQASEIMSRAVISVPPTTGVREVARIMTEKHVSGVPVVATDGHLLGIVSQSDLLHRAELGTERKRKAWLRFFQNRDSLAAEFLKAHGLKAADVMSRTVVSVREDSDLQEVASVLDANNIKRVPVMSQGKLVGIVTRGDLVRALSRQTGAASTGKVEDGTLQKRLLEQMRKQAWLNTSYVNLTVNRGSVELWGLVESKQQRDALNVLVQEQAGVADVKDHLKVGIPSYSEF